MQRILVGVDGSPPANDALSWSADIARRGGLDLVAARVFTPTQAELSPEIDTDLHAQQRRELEHWCERVDRVGRTTAVLLDGDPPEALLDAAADLGADLLVVGGRDAGPLRHADPASVADQLAHTASLPVAIVPHAGAAPVAHFVVGIDGSAGSHPAVDFVADLAARLSVGVTAVVAFEPFVELVAETDPHSWRHEAERYVRRLIAGMEEMGVTVEIDVDRDIHPVAAIARALDAHPASVACVGAGSLSDVTGLRRARIPLRLLDRKSSTVIMVPPEPKE